MVTGQIWTGRLARNVTTSLALLLTAACVGHGVDGVGGADGARSDPTLQPRASFVDPRGQRWQLQRAVAHFAEDAALDVHDDEAQPPEDARTSSQAPWQGLSDEEAVKRLRPIVLTPDNLEYTLAPDDALQFVQRLRDSLPHVPRAGDQSLSETATLAGEGSARALSQRSQRVLSEERFPTQTFGGDDRVNMNAAAGELPWVFIAAMAGAGTCTAFKLLNNHTAVTAAHCVHNGKDWNKRKALRFAAGASEPRANLGADCYSISVPAGWDGADAEYDYAVIRLREDGLDGGAKCDFAGYDVGHFGYKVVDDCSVDVPLNLAGYPSPTDPDHDVPGGDWSYPTLFSDYRSDGWSGCAGIFPSALFFYNDGSGGQSGAPVWTYFDSTNQNAVRAIFRGSVTSPLGGSNRGRRLDESLVSWLDLNAGF